MSISHLCDKYSASSSFKVIESDLANLRTHLTTLSMEVKNGIETRDELRSRLKEVGSVIPKVSEAILRLRNEVSEGNGDIYGTTKMKKRMKGKHFTIIEAIKTKSLEKLRGSPRSAFRKCFEDWYVISDGDYYQGDSIKIEMGLHTKLLLNALSLENVRDMVRGELEMYDADKTGRTDFALESAGGSILSTRNTITYSVGEPVLTLFGIPLCLQKNTPNTVIQAGALPGECWAFKGSTGSIVIRLMDKIYVSGVSLEHISPSISPTGGTSTAPREFSVWGLDNADDKIGFPFGEFIYDNAGPPVQYFPVQTEPGTTYQIIELKIHSNSGNREYTCVYRIRVHGSLRR